MCVAVYFHVDFLVESFSTIGTHKWFKVGVSAHVRMQIRRPVECLVTLRTDIRFDGGMCQPVACQVSRLSECTTTNLTFKWLVARVDPLKI